MRKFIQSRSAWEIMMISLLAFFATVGVVMATTTIGTNITTDGSIYATSTLLVDGAATFKSTVTLSAANLTVSTGYGLDSTGAVLNIGTTTATTVNIGSTGATVAVRGNMTFPTGYGIDVASGVLNIGTTTATRINIGSATSPVVIANASSTLANFGSGTTVSGLLFGTCTVNFGTSIGAGQATTTNCVATGITTSYKVFVTPSTLEPNFVFNSASSTAPDTIQVQAFNSTTTAVTISSHTWSWMAIK